MAESPLSFVSLSVTLLQIIIMNELFSVVGRHRHSYLANSYLIKPSLLFSVLTYNVFRNKITHNSVVPIYTCLL